MLAAQVLFQRLDTPGNGRHSLCIALVLIEQLVEALALGALPEKLVYLHANQLLAVRHLQLRSRQFALLGAKGVFELLFFEKDGVEFGDLAAQLLGTRRFGGGFNGGGTARSRRFGRCRGG